MALENKSEIEIFYKTHNMSIKEVAKHFNISYRTLAHWISVGKWKAGEAIENLQEPKNPIVKKGASEVLDIAKIKIKNEIRQNLGNIVSNIDNMILENLLEASTDEILTKTMSLNFIQKNIALSAIIAKDRLMRLVATDNPKNDPIIIACAEKVAKLFYDMQVSVYGKDVINIQVDNVENLSLQEINKMLQELEN